jgi:hypothetical protein
MKKPYEAPVLREHGSLHELTEQQFNKVGQNPDVHTATHPGMTHSMFGS